MRTTEAHPLGFLLRRLDDLISGRFEATLGRGGISRRQWQLLNVLAAAPTTGAALDAAVAPFLDHAAGETAEQHLAPLVAHGHVHRDGETYALTQGGRVLFEELASEVEATRSLIVDGLGPDEYDRTVATLQTMIGNLERDALSRRDGGA